MRALRFQPPVAKQIQRLSTTEKGQAFFTAPLWPAPLAAATLTRTSARKAATSAEEIAALTGTSVAAINRFSRVAGFEGFSHLKTVLGEVKFGKGGEWAEPRVLQVQFQNVSGNDPLQFKDVTTQVVVSPPAYASGTLIYPYEKAK